MPLHERVIFLLMSLPFGSNALRLLPQSIVPEGCSDDQSFHYWRHCKPSDELVKALKVTANFKSKRDTNFECAAKKAISSPSQAQLTLNKSETHMTKVLSQISPLVGMVYVVCIDCHALRVPQGLRNILLVDGRASDECLNAGEAHHQKVAFAHKAAVAHAAKNNLANLTIIEEDVMINPMLNELPDFIQLGSQIQVRLAEKHNQLVRFTSLPWNLVREDGICKKEHCKCHSVTPNLCLLPRGCDDVHDSSFYMIANSMFDEFIAMEGEVFDLQLFAAFDSVLVTPPITLQRGFGCDGTQCGSADQLQMWNMYQQSCVVAEQT